MWIYCFLFNFSRNYPRKRLLLAREDFLKCPIRNGFLNKTLKKGIRGERSRKVNKQEKGGAEGSLSVDKKKPIYISINNEKG